MQIKLITSIVMGLLLVVSGVTIAADAGNSVYINQVDMDNSTVSITQSGSGNLFGDVTNSNPFAISGSNLQLNVTQDGMNNSILGNWNGNTSVASINQVGNSNQTLLNFGNYGTSSGTLGIDINGDNNNTTLNVGQTATADNYKYQLNIGSTFSNGTSTANSGTSSNNTVTSTINSTNVDTKIAIAGNHNTVTTAQSGGTGHKIDLNIIGSSNTVGITQDGANANTAIVNITGTGSNTNAISIMQH